MGILDILLVVALAVTLGVLLVGVGAMIKGGEFNRKYGNILMRARIVAQAVALALLFALYLLNRR